MRKVKCVRCVLSFVAKSRCQHSTHSTQRWCDIKCAGDSDESARTAVVKKWDVKLNEYNKFQFLSANEIFISQVEQYFVVHQRHERRICLLSKIVFFIKKKETQPECEVVMVEREKINVVNSRPDSGGEQSKKERTTTMRKAVYNAIILMSHVSFSSWKLTSTRKKQKKRLRVVFMRARDSNNLFFSLAIRVVKKALICRRLSSVCAEEGWSQRFAKFTFNEYLSTRTHKKGVYDQTMRQHLDNFILIPHEYNVEHRKLTI